VIPYHLRALGIYMAQLAIFAIVEKNHVQWKEMRPGGMTIVKQQVVYEVLGVDLSPSESFKDWFIVRPWVMLKQSNT
jgi:hypothetical protein